MGISKAVSYTADIYRAAVKTLGKGKKYVTKEAKDAFANHTQIGRRLREGVHSAREAVNIKMDNFSDKKTAGIVEKVKARITAKAPDACKSLSKDKNFMKIFNQYLEKRQIVTGGKINADDLTNEEFLQVLIEGMGIGPTKAAQIISSEQKIMSQIKSPELVKAIQNTRSNCSFSRPLEEAQEVLNKSFPGKNIVIEKEMSAGSIGAAYLVRHSDGTKAVLKMLKKGVDKEELELEEKVLSRILKEFSASPKEAAQYRDILKNYYRDWAEELNFFKEMQNNKLLAKGAKRYKVADITDISKDGACIIMNKANGIQMNNLVSMLKDYKANPSEFAKKYSKEIAENPWLADPEKVAKELPATILKAFDEQFMFLKKGGKTLMHGDPHTGNFFITVNEKGKLIPEFIDTGNCVARTSAQVKDDISFFTNYLVGNSDGVAKYLVKQCGYTAANKKMLTDKISKDIQNMVFGKKQNIKKFSDVQANFNTILETHGLQMSPENATALKAQMQFFTAISEAGKLSGQTLDIATLMKDIPQASWGMIKTGANPYGAIKDALKFAYYNQKQAVGTAYQFTIKDVDRVLKSDDTLQVIA